MAEQPDRHEWLDLLEVDGPFLSRPALAEVFDDAWPPRISNEQREAIGPPEQMPTAWYDDELDEDPIRQVDRLLTDVLGYVEGQTLKFHPGTVIHPIYDEAIVSPYAVGFSKRDPDHPRLVVLAGLAAAETPGELDPEAITTHYGWPSTVVQRAALAARGLGAELALVTNGYQHLIVWVGSGITGYAWIDPSLYRLDRRLADAFVALCSAASVTTDADTSTADLLRLSQEKQLDVTEKLGIQVRRAAEALVNAVSRANRNTDGKLLAGVAPDEVYAGVVTVLMRTVFLLNAEERDLISSGDLWDRAYSVSGLLDQLDEDHYRHQGVMRRRHGAWLRLLAAARSVHGGVHHSQMNVPAYGGNLFDPVRHPFLEGVGSDGEVFDVGVVDDATTRHVLDLVQRLNGQRLSYRAFSVEQIGQVYESLLDHSAVSVPEGQVVLGLVGSKGAEAEVKLADIEEQNTNGKLADWLAKNHDPSNGQSKAAKWQTRLDRPPNERVTATLAQACHGNADTLARVEKFASLLRTDPRNVALVFLPGDVYVTETSSRRDTGTAYTTPEFAAEIAHHALEHLVYEPGPHNEEDETEWKIKQPDEILELRICDPAVGSGAILVAAVRYLANKLIESRLEHNEITARGIETAATDPLATDPYVQARRDVVAQCIYAVDRDPMAVEMAKLSLWLVTMARGRPFTFLDHAIKCGDSLLGISSLDQLRRLHLGESAVTQIGLDLAGGRVEGLGGYFSMIDERINQALSLLEPVRDGDVADARDAQARAALSARANRHLDDLRLVADAIAAVSYCAANQGPDATSIALRSRVLPLVVDVERNRDELTDLANERPADVVGSFGFLHWAIEFPEIMTRGGFDCIVANPPFMKSQGMKRAIGSTYRNFLIRYLANGKRGKADLVAYFALRIRELARSTGFISTNSLAQGDSLLVGLQPILETWTIARADRSLPWPGGEGVHVSRIWMTSLAWNTPRTLDGVQVSSISASLQTDGDLRGPPKTLRENSGRAFQGYQVIADGFEITADLADELCASTANAKEVIRPFANGDTLHEHATIEPRRWVIDFGLRSEAQAAEFGAVFSYAESVIKPEVLAKSAPNEAGKPSSYDKWDERWWTYWRARKNTREAIADLETVLALVGTSKVFYPRFVPASWCLSHSFVIFAYDDPGHFGVLTSAFHWWWAIAPPGTGGSSFKADPRYTTTKSFATFPQPKLTHELDRAGRQLNTLRDQLMLNRGVGLRVVYQAINDATDDSTDIVELRTAHANLDRVVLDAYQRSEPDIDWSVLELDHGFYDCGGFGIRFTLSEESRARMLQLLLELNFRRYASETGLTYASVLKETGNV